MIEIPKQVSNLNLPDPSLINHYKELERRTLWIDDIIDDGCLEIIRHILAFNMEDAGVPPAKRIPIKLMFFTPGGDLDVNNSLIDMIQLSKTPVWGINIGIAQSAGAFIFLSCHRRFALPRSVFLLHQGSAGMSGTHEQVSQITAEYRRQIAELTEFVGTRTRIPEATLKRKLKTEWYVGANEAVDLGICDEIVNDVDILL